MKSYELDLVDLDIPLVVDLDETLIKSDSLHEGVIKAILKNPCCIFKLIFALSKGKSFFKYKVMDVFKMNADALCYRKNLLELIECEKVKGRCIHLVTAANQNFAEAVQQHLLIFEKVQGSDQNHNLKGINKLNWLRKTFPQGFIYAGDHHSDIPIWKASRGAILVGNGKRYINMIRELNIPVLVLEDEPFNKMREWFRLLRVHQWAKNLLVFVPLFLAHISSNQEALIKTSCAFIAFILVASATYIINDLCDIEADRRHQTKRFRPLAAGTIPALQALLMCILLLLAGSAVLASISAGVLWCGVLYFIVTVIYSLWLKRVPLLDVAVIGSLFTVRVITGSVVNNLPLSPWLNAFSILFFFSLALAKRHVEVMSLPAGISERVNGRGYLYTDWPLTLMLGIASTISSIVIMLLFLTQEQMVSAKYASPNWLLLEPVCVFLWTLRLWLLSHRKILNQDPVIFAVKDRISLFLALVVLVSFIRANY